MCSHDPQTRATPPNAAECTRYPARMAVVLFVVFMEQFVLSPVHCDIIAAQRRVAEMPSQPLLRVMHFSYQGREYK